MAQEILEISRSQNVARIVMNRPEARNSLSLEMMAQMQAALDELNAARDVHAIILAANGPGFCAGHDLKEITAARQKDDQGKAFFEETMARCSTLMQSIVRSNKPVIAQVHGIATAAGCQLVASCDLAVAATSARFATPGVKIGLFCSTPMVALSRNIGRKAAMKMLLTGDFVEAEEAKGLGLVNDVVEDDALAQAAFDLALRVAGAAPATVRIGKEAFYAQAEMDLSAAYRYASEVMVQNMLAQDAKEGIGAFVEKRTPSWQPL